MTPSSKFVRPPKIPWWKTAWHWSRFNAWPWIKKHWWMTGITSFFTLVILMATITGLFKGCSKEDTKPGQPVITKNETYNQNAPYSIGKIEQHIAGPPQRHVDDKFIQELKPHLPSDKKISIAIMYISNNDECFKFASEIRNHLTSAGYKAGIDDFTEIGMPRRPPCTIIPNSNPFMIVVGPAP